MNVQHERCGGGRGLQVAPPAAKKPSIQRNDISGINRTECIRNLVRVGCSQAGPQPVDCWERGAQPGPKAKGTSRGAVRQNSGFRTWREFGKTTRGGWEREVPVTEGAPASGDAEQNCSRGVAAAGQCGCAPRPPAPGATCGAAATAAGPVTQLVRGLRCQRTVHCPGCHAAPPEMGGPRVEKANQASAPGQSSHKVAQLPVAQRLGGAGVVVQLAILAGKGQEVQHLRGRRGR